MEKDKIKIKILFVCLGNICRSPAAESIFRDLVISNNLQGSIEVDSAGIHNYHEGDQADFRMIKAAAARGYKITSISRPVNNNDFKYFDMIVGMDNNNFNSLNKIAKDDVSRLKISKMCDYNISMTDKEVPDPYYGGEDGFNYVLDLLEDSADGLLNYVINKWFKK